MTDTESSSPPSSRRAFVGAAVVLPVVSQLGNLGCKATLPIRVVQAGEAATVAQDGPTQVEGYDVFIIRGPEGLAAIGGQCPHRRCAVRLADDFEGYRCRCHGSEFALDGSLREGPADTDLPWLLVRVESGRVLVDPQVPVPKGTWTPVG